MEYFVAVAEELHFGRAALRMNISQPPLSMQIRKLEEELGTRLFRRTSRKVALTEAGRVLLGRAREILGKIAQAASEVRAVGEGSIGRVVVGFVGPAMESGLSEAIRAFRERHPGIRLALHELGTAEQLEALRTGRLQVGFLRLFGHRLEGLQSRVIWREPYVLAMPQDHPLSSSERIPLEALAGEPLIMFPRADHPELYDRLMAGFRDAGFSPEVVQEARTKHTTVALVAAGIGLALVPASVARLSGLRVRWRPVDGDLPAVEISMVWKRGEGEVALEHFIQVLSEEKRRENF